MRLYGDLLAIGAISTRYIIERGNAIAFGEKGHAAIVDHTGRVMAHPLASWIADMKQIAGIDPVARMLRRETGTTIFYSPALKADMVAGFTYVPTTGWGVMIPQPLSEIEQHADEAAFWALMIGLGGLVSAAMLSWFLAGHFTRPIAAVVGASQRMANGDLEARVEADSALQSREADELAEAFNAMAAEIGRKNAALRDALDRAEEGAQAKTNFLTTISHEIRTPMNGVLGTSEMLLETELDSEQRRIAQTINNSAKSLLEIVNDVLDMSRIEAGRIEILTEPVMLRPLIEGLMAELSPQAEVKGLTLFHEVAEDLPDTLEIDPTRLRQVLVNLINNAIKFTERGWVRVILRRTAEPDGGQCLEIAVQDTGIGIPEEVLPTLFKPFVQADASTTRRFGGSGLGLSISRRLCELMGGRIAATSVEGEGSVFRVQLPLDDVPGLISDAGVRSPALPGPADLERLRGRRVLVAEDHSTNRWMLSRQLERLGLTADVREDGAQALNAFDANAFDVVVTDYLMPAMDGVALTRAIRERDSARGRHTPVLGLTANAFQDSIDRCVAAGMDAVLTKPTEQATIGQVIAALMDGRPVALPRRTNGRKGPIPLFDSTTAMELFEGQVEEGKAWVADFVASLRGKASALESMRRDMPVGSETVFPVLHAIKGVSGAAGAKQLEDVARELAEDARAGKADAVGAGLDGLLVLITETCDAAENFAAHWPKAVEGR